jgi:inositol-1,3,4-trisphosphate 5/6-kinase/inositol-tetrakisphosphate 1-kinase
MRLHGGVSDDEDEDAVMDPALLPSSLPNGAAVAAAVAAPRLLVGYALTKKKVKSFLQPKLLSLAR